MKPPGAFFEYTRQRDEDLMRAYRKAMQEATHISMPEIFRKTVMMPSQRFWVSEERAAIVISALLRGKTFPKMNTMKRMMYREIHDRVQQLRKLHPDMCISELTFHVVRQQAPQFYITPGSAKVIISKIRRRKRESDKNS